MCIKDIAKKSGKTILLWLPLIMIAGSFVNFTYSLQAKTQENTMDIERLEKSTIYKIDTIDKKHDQKCTDTRALLSTNIEAIDKKLDIVLEFVKEKR